MKESFCQNCSFLPVLIKSNPFCSPGRQDSRQRLEVTRRVTTYRARAPRGARSTEERRRLCAEQALPKKGGDSAQSRLSSPEERKRLCAEQALSRRKEETLRRAGSPLGRREEALRRAGSPLRREETLRRAGSSLRREETLRRGVSGRREETLRRGVSGRRCLGCSCSPDTSCPIYTVP